jgi:hypothetical protein
MHSTVHIVLGGKVFNMVFSIRHPHHTHGCDEDGSTIRRFSVGRQDASFLTTGTVPVVQIVHGHDITAGIRVLQMELSVHSGRII